MIALTSISPKHINGDIQRIAIDSWVKLGFKVYSFNSKKEIEILKYDNVTFIESETHRDRPLIEISTMLDFAKKCEDPCICLINSDIILNDSENVLPTIIHRLPSEATIVKRRDFTNDINVNRTFELGIDVFFVHKNYIDLIKAKNFFMGFCWWDYSVPYSLIKKGIRVNLLRESFAYHRSHNTQYSNKSWVDFARVFEIEHGIKAKNPMQLNTRIYSEIMAHCEDNYNKR